MAQTDFGTTLGGYVATSGKIGALFSERGLLDLADYLVPEREKRDALLTGLARLQWHIYVLDRYGETTWNVKRSDLLLLWRGIHAAAHELGVPSDLMGALLADIIVYQNVELGMRQGSIPVTEDVFAFYWLKTCDVRLMRAVLLWSAGDCVAPGFRRCLELADIVAEVNDDMVDVQEDEDDFNGNRFLLSREILGDKQTFTVYASLLTSVVEQIKVLQEGTRFLRWR